MDNLKAICEALVSFAKQAWLLPKTIPAAAKRRREQGVLDAAEAERLDRIRNPSEYRGK
jgi:hypothetical protein